MTTAVIPRAQLEVIRRFCVAPLGNPKNKWTDLADSSKSFQPIMEFLLNRKHILGTRRAFLCSSYKDPLVWATVRIRLWLGRMKTSHPDRCSPTGTVCSIGSQLGDPWRMHAEAILLSQTVLESSENMANFAFPKSIDHNHLFKTLHMSLQRKIRENKRPITTLRVQVPPKKVFWGGFGGLNPFSGGTWTLRGPVSFSEKILPRRTSHRQCRFLSSQLRILLRHSQEVGLSEAPGIHVDGLGWIWNERSYKPGFAQGDFLFLALLAFWDFFLGFLKQIQVNHDNYVCKCISIFKNEQNGEQSD